jgi:predicted nucleic acid-binding protein
MIAIDSNVLLRLADPASSDCLPARNATRVLRRAGQRLVIFPQNLYEFWSVATRPAGKPPAGSNGLGMTPVRADQWMDYLLRTFVLLLDAPELVVHWRTLLRASGVTGIKCHDVRLVAAMQTHNVLQMLTFNEQDFRRFPNLTILDPHTI